jgi:hypothetical protein
MLTNVIGFLLCGVMLVFVTSFVIFGFALFKNKAELIDISRRTMIYSFVTFAVVTVILQFAFR